MIQVIENRIQSAYLEHNAKIETYLRVRIKPRPKWMPEDIWRVVIKKLFVLERFDR